MVGFDFTPRVVFLSLPMQLFTLWLQLDLLYSKGSSIKYIRSIFTTRVARISGSTF